MAGDWGTRRSQPAGPFQHDYRSDGDARTHLERLNPLDGNSPVDGTGMGGVNTPLPLQTDNTTNRPLAVQFPGGIVPEPILYEDVPTGDL